VTPTSSAPHVGSILAGRYELVRFIARGGMGEVYEAEDRQLQRQVAVKVFRAGAAADRSRFDSEIVVLAALNHPGLVHVYDAGEHHGDAFVVLELVDGPTLASRLAGGAPVPSAEVAALGASLADALAYVHDQGVVHRDVTPSNVICGTDGRPRLADFGIARLIDTTRVTAVSTAVGTAAYMAPEQVQGHDVTPAADVYALGLVLLELHTGRRAFTGTPQEVAVARLVRSPDVAAGVPDAWRPLLATMTDRAAANRPSAAEVRDQLNALRHSASMATGALAAVPAASVVAPPDGQPPGPTDAPTHVLTAVGGGTTVMPVALVPAEETLPSPGSPPTLRRRWVAVAVMVALVLLVVAAAVQSGGGIDVPTSTTTVTEPVVATTLPPSTTTTAPAITVPPPTEKDPKGGGDKPGGEKDD